MFRPNKRRGVELYNSIATSLTCVAIANHPTMADDTRQNQRPQPEDLSREALTVNPNNKAFAGRQWEDPKAQPYKPPENANMMAGGTMHTAGGEMAEVSLTNAIGSIKAEEFQEIHKKPCVRTALMTGIGAGFGLGGARAILGGNVVSRTRV